MGDDFSPSNPKFYDRNGVATHIGDAVSYEVSTRYGDASVKTGIVERISFKGKSDAMVTMVKVSCRGQNICADKLTRIDETTVEGKIKVFLSECKGVFREDKITEFADWIREYAGEGGEPEDDEEQG